MPASNPYGEGAQPIQGPGPTGNEGFPVAIVPATGSDPVPVTIIGSGAVTIADGADVAEGAIADAKVTGDTAGTVSAKLRGLSYLLALVTDTVNGWLKVAVQGVVSVAQSGAWSVGVSNFPAVQPVNDNGGSLTVDDGGGSLTVDGAVSVSNFPAVQPVNDNGGSLTVDGTVTANQGTAGAAAWPVKVAAGDDVTEGNTTDVAVTGDSAGTVNAHLRGLTKAEGDPTDAAVQGDTSGTLAAKVRGTNKALGSTGDAAVTTDVSGSFLGFVRGIIKILNSVWDSANGRWNVIAAQGAGQQEPTMWTVRQGNNQAGNLVAWAVTPTGKTINASFTRPANVTAYAAGDAVTDSVATPTQMTFSGCARANGGSGRVENVILIDSANQATKASLELWLFDTAVTADNDNAVFTPTDAECATLVGIWALNATLGTFVGDATAGAGGNVVTLGMATGATNTPMPNARGFVCGGASTSLFGLLVVRNAYTPVSGEQFTVRLQIVQD